MRIFSAAVNEDLLADKAIVMAIELFNERIVLNNCNKYYLTIL
jgi:hypothetical protein